MSTLSNFFPYTTTTKNYLKKIIQIVNVATPFVQTTLQTFEREKKSLNQDKLEKFHLNLSLWSVSTTMKMARTPPIFFFFRLSLLTWKADELKISTTIDAQRPIPTPRVGTLLYAFTFFFFSLLNFSLFSTFPLSTLLCAHLITESSSFFQFSSLTSAVKRYSLPKISCFLFSGCFFSPFLFP